MPLCREMIVGNTPPFDSHSSSWKCLCGLKKKKGECKRERETTLNFAKWNDHIVSYNISIKRITELSSLLSNMSTFWLWRAPCIQWIHIHQASLIGNLPHPVEMAEDSFKVRSVNNGTWKRACFPHFSCNTVFRCCEIPVNCFLAQLHKKGLDLWLPEAY